MGRLHQVNQLVKQHIINDPHWHGLQAVGQPDEARARVQEPQRCCWFVTHETAVGSGTWSRAGAR